VSGNIDLDVVFAPIDPVPSVEMMKLVRKAVPDTPYPGIRYYPPANTGLGLGADIRLERLPRERCRACGRRRVVFRIVVTVMDLPVATPPLCYDCMAPRRQAPTLHMDKSRLIQPETGTGASQPVEVGGPSSDGLTVQWHTSEE
jgi:hypothetical protein